MDENKQDQETAPDRWHGVGGCYEINAAGERVPVDGPALLIAVEADAAEPVPPLSVAPPAEQSNRPIQASRKRGRSATS